MSKTQWKEESDKRLLDVTEINDHTMNFAVQYYPTRCSWNDHYTQAHEHLAEMVLTFGKPSLVSVCTLSP